jgi:CBS domain-containing protein
MNTSQVTAGELCNRQVVVCEPELTLVEAAKRMRAHHVGCLVVVESVDGNEPVGVVTDRDLVVDGIAAAPEDFASFTVANVMTSELVTASERDDVAGVLAQMTARGIRRMPIVDDAGRLQGILTYDDILEWFAEQLGALSRVVKTELRVEEQRLGPTS